MTPYLYAMEPALMVLSAAAFSLGRKVTITRCAGFVGAVGLVVGVSGMAAHGILKVFGLV